MKNGNQPAYPNIDKFDNGTICGADVTGPSGLTKREVFAMAAMQGLLSNTGYIQRLETNFKEKAVYDMNAMCAREAVDMADELLKQLELLKP